MDANQPRFMCWYCSEKCEEFITAIDHALSLHPTENVKLRILRLDDKAGVFRYCSKDFEVIPKTVAEGYHIVGHKNETITIECKADECKTGECKADENKTDEPASNSDSDESIDVNDGSSADVTRLTELAPVIAERMKSLGHLSTWVKFNNMVSDNTFPMENICFQLFLDVVKFLGNDTSIQMRYSPEVKSFWSTGQRLFHGRFLRFMSGPKSAGQVIDGSSLKGKFVPGEAKINFAVPSPQCLRLTTAMSNTSVRPGILDDCISAIAKDKKQVKICFDGKKINSCLSEAHGDVDLFGCEKSPTLKEQMDRKDEEMNFLQDVMEKVELLKTHAIDKETVIQDVHAAVKLISVRIKELREHTSLKAEGIKKFKAMGSPDWRKSKFLFVISGMQASLFEMNEAITSCLNTTDRLCRICAEVQEADNLYSSERILNLQEQENYVCLTTESGNQTVQETPEIERHILKQRSEIWFNLRKSAKVTGSTAYKALGLQTLKEQVNHFDETFNKKPHSQPPPEMNKYLQHGMANEIHALATLVGKVLPVYFPTLKYIEEGCCSLKNGGENFLIVSPDGSGRIDPTSPASMAFEFKCPFPEKRYTPQVHYRIPKYYIVQLLAEMAALQCSTLLFLSYTEESSTVFQVQFSEQLWKKIYEELIFVYGTEIPKRPTKLRAQVKELREDLQTFASENIHFLCEVPSLKAFPCSHIQGQDSNPFGIHAREAQKASVVDAQYEQTLFKAQLCVKETFNLCRKRATEIFIFMCSDLDRLASTDAPHSLPIAYGLQGSSLTTDTAKKMLLKVLSALDDKGLDTLVFSCDGQWINLITRDLEGKPLTQLQAQKSFWERVVKHPKQSLVKFFDDLTISNPQQSEDTRNTAPIKAVSLTKRHLNMLTISKRQLSTKDSSTENTEDLGRTLALLPNNLEEQVDSQTYQDIIQIVRSLVSETSETADSSSTTERDCAMQADSTDTPKIELKQSDWTVVLSALCSDEKSQDWKIKTEENLKDIFSSTGTIRQLSKQEVKTCTKAIKQLFATETKHILLSFPKWRLVNELAKVLGFQPMDEDARPGPKKKFQSLKDLCVKQVQKLPKLLLGVLYAEITYTEKDWRESVQFASSSTVNNTEDIAWYSYPCMRQREPKYDIPLLGIIDSHHILANLRNKCCSTGIPCRGIHREAWYKVAKETRHNDAGLTLAHVEDLIDKQSNAFAQLTFSAKVECAMRENGDDKEADFCNMIRNWYAADDEGGIDSVTRLNSRLRLRSWLLEGYNPQEFPPPARYVAGVPIVTFESLITNIERKIQAYNFVDAYNPRSLSSLDAENFFSVLGDYVPCGSRLSIRPADIPSAMKTACEISLLQMSSDRAFYMHTSRAPVYPKVRLLDVDSGDTEPMQTDESYANDMAVIHTRDHAFDLAQRKRRKEKRKTAGLSGPSRPSKGARGVRQYHKTDESKIPPHVRAGIDLI